MKKIMINIIIILSIIITSNSFAEMYYTSDVLIGEKAAGMGGAFSAIADSAEACYYNPAGLILANVPYLSVSAQIAEYNAQKGKILLSKDEKFFSQELVPSFSGISRDFWNGRLGFSIVIPYYFAYELHEPYKNQKIPGFDTATLILDMKTMDKTYLIGPSYAYKVNKRLSLGATLYMHYKVLKEQNNLYVNGSGKDTNKGYFTALQQSINENEGTGTGFSGILGLLYQQSKKINLSMVIKSGDYSENTVNYRGITLINTHFINNDSTYFQAASPLDENEENKFRMPPATTFGMAVRIIPKLVFNYDISYSFPIKYNINKYSYNNKISQYERISAKIKKNSVFNHNFGGEYMIKESVPLRFGFYTNYSLAPKIDNEYINYYNSLSSSVKSKTQPPEKQSHIDKFGVALSSGVISENSTLTIGIKYSFGKGKSVNRDIETLKYESQDMEFTGYAVGFAGSYWF